MFNRKRFLHLGSISILLLAGLMLISHPRVSSTAFAATCNTVATGAWSNNCTVSEGNISNFVYAIQVATDEANTGCTPVTEDGDFGPETFTAVECFQRAKNLTVDGIVGPQTWQALRDTLTFDPPTMSGWDYYYGPDSVIDYFRQWASSGVWYVRVGLVGSTHWCQMNLSSPC